MDEKKYSKKRFKDDIKKMSTGELHTKLQELESDKIKAENNMRAGTGTSARIRNYPESKNDWPNLKDIKKNIARIKTILSIRGI